MERTRALVENYIEIIENNFSNLVNNETVIHDDIEKFINGPSKRIRSIFCLLYLKANNASINDNVINILTAGELIHNASLLHDDVIDDSEERRGAKTFNIKYNSKVSILSGDYVMSTAIKCLMQINNKSILDIFLNTTKEMCNAELKQYTIRNKEISFNEYVEIISGKTASLFRAIMESTALLTDLDINSAKHFGELFGQLFQINNDTQNESVINDKQNGLNTIIDILGIEKTQILKDNYKEKMREIIKGLPNNKYSNGLGDLINLL